MFGKVWFGSLAAGVVVVAAKFIGRPIDIVAGVELVGLVLAGLFLLGVGMLVVGIKTENKKRKQDKKERALIRTHQLAVAREYFDRAGV